MSWRQIPAGIRNLLGKHIERNLQRKNNTPWAFGDLQSIMRAILSSSSGQISGQCVNPKYTCIRNISIFCRSPHRKEIALLFVSSAYQHILSPPILILPLLAIMVQQIQWTSNLRLSHALGHLRYPLPFHLSPLIAKVKRQPNASREK